MDPDQHHDSKDLAGVTCTDDSTAGNMKMDAGKGRAAALCYWRWAERDTILNMCIVLYCTIIMLSLRCLNFIDHT